jgi:hypothetical protein
MEALNFTQFCAKNGFIDDYSVLDHAALSPSGRKSEKEHNRQMSLMQERAESNKQAHLLFYEGVKNGEIIDASGELSMEGILSAERMQLFEKTTSEIRILHGKIEFIHSLGGMSHLANGKLKKGYQAQVDLYSRKIEELNSTL